LHTTDPPSLTILITAGGTLAGKALGPAPPHHEHPLWLPAGSALAIERIARFHLASPEVAEVLVVSDREAAGGPPADLHCLEGVRLVRVPPQAHIGGSIAAALPAVRTPWVVVNPITTLPSHRAAAAMEILIGAEPRLREDWSSLLPLGPGAWRFIPKRLPPDEGRPSHPFTGILAAPAALLEEVLAGLQETELGDLLAVAERLVRSHGARVVATQWFDLGHRASVADSHRSRLPSRAFNRLRHCRRRDAIVKESSDRSRLAEEGTYLASLPPAVRRHFPALLPSEAGEEEALVMEAIPFPNLAELFLHWRIGPNAWLAILERLGAILAEFAAARPAVEGSAAWLWGAKLQRRWEELCRRGDPVLSDWRQAEMRINGRWYPCLDRVVGEVLEALAPLQQHSRLQLIHGDLCFNNILCDPLYTTVRLIDPRGEEPPGGIGPVGMGDSRYDLIKLNHSVAGLYDATVNNLFALRRQGQELELQLYAPPNHAFLQEAFEQLLLGVVPAGERRILTTSLFLSMLPLHREDPARLLALAATGVLLWHDELAGAIAP
jgi:hypothetical protein